MIFNSNQTIIERDLSEAIKGVAILLIVFAHNSALCPVSSWGYGYLYSFHLAIFMILPFFYDKSYEVNKKVVKRIICRNYIPYCWIFILCCILAYLANGMINSSHIYVYGFLNLFGEGCKDACGFVFPWFLPAFCMLSLLRIFSSKYTLLSVLFLSVGIVCCVDYCQFTWNVLFKYFSPFYVVHACYYITLGSICKLAFDRIPYWMQISCVSFVLLSILAYFDIVSAPKIPYLFSISGFSLVYALCHFLKRNKIIRYIGRNSLYIYIFHVIILNILLMVIPHFYMYGWVIYFVTLGICLIISSIINRNKFVNKLLFYKQ